MKKNSVFISVLAVAILLFGAWAYYGTQKTYRAITTYQECVSAGFPVMESYPEQCRTPDGRTFLHEITTGSNYSDFIHVNLSAGSELRSPAVITGEARGGWYFEASFPVKLVDAAGQVLAQAPAQAQGDWMTNEFVPFTVTLPFIIAPSTKTGTVIFANDNPSGLPENDKEVRVAVRFKEPMIVVGSFGKKLTLKEGETASFDNGAVLVALTRIDDSRCKPGVQCIWAGELSPVFSVRFGTDLSDEVRLGTTTTQMVSKHGYTFALQDATIATATIIVTKQ